MFLVRFALHRPYSVVALIILVMGLGIHFGMEMPTDIFPEINIPVVSVVWTYNGMSAEEMQNRILTIHERQMASLVDDVERMEANSYNGVGVIKVYLHEGADVTRAITQLGSSAQAVMKYMPRNIVPPLVIRYGATDVPIIQLTISSSSVTDTKLNDLGQNAIRPALAVVQGAQVPYPYGGKPRVVMVDLDPQALQSKGISGADVTAAITAQNLIAPSGDVKIGDIDYSVGLNNSTKTIEAINNFPIKQSGRVTVFLRDVGHVHDGFQVQTNSVSADGRPASLMMIRKTGGASTLKVINAVKDTLGDIRRSLPAGVTLKPVFDQSIFVKAALNGVLMGGAMAAGLTAIMILLFLGNWRLTLIILTSIPMSIIAAVLALKIGGQTFNTMTLGGFALATGILVDDATVVIENIERNLGLGKDLIPAIEDGCAEIMVPTLVSTISICIVFIPVFLLKGTAHYLFAPLSLSVVLSFLASLVLSRTLVPAMFKSLMKSYVLAHRARGKAHESRSGNLFSAIHYAFEGGFHYFRNTYRNYLAWAVHRPGPVVALFLFLIGASCFLFPQIGMDFFPQVDAGQMRLHVRAPAGTKIERSQELFAEVEREIENIVGKKEIDVVLDNIGLPYSGINLALGDTATVGPMDGEVLISLKEKHSPTAGHMADLRRELPRRFPEMQFFFQPADIVNQVLNFGQPAPIDIRITGPHVDVNYTTARTLLAQLKRVPGIADAHIFQVPDAPLLQLDVDRTIAGEMGMDQRDVADNVLVTLNSSAMVAPNFWLNPANSVSYPLVVQTPSYKVDSMKSLATLPLTGKGLGRRDSQLLMNVAQISRGRAPMVLSQLNLRPVFDIHADVQGTDLGSVATAIERVLAANKPPESSGVKLSVAGQVETMRESFTGLFWGIGGAVVLVFLLLMMNFQSVIDPIIVLAAVPCALSGVMWMLYGTHTHISVPALMGSLMCIGLATANSLLVVTFANQRMEAGDDALTAAIAAGYTRLRPVIMTAGAMILGMIPMAFGVGEGGEQNAPLGRAVIGGLLFATFATLIFVPAVYRMCHGQRNKQAVERA